jgi:lipoprotein-anchoring transpeptidase ErfK/SrfK
MATSSPWADRGPAARIAAPVAAKRKSHHRGRGAFLVFLLLGAAGVAGYGTGYEFQAAPDRAEIKPSVPIPQDAKALKQLDARLKQRQRQVQFTLDRKAPHGVYIVIDQTQNQLFLRKDSDQLLEAKCSAGSGMVLQERGGRGRRWVFDTPRGAFHVRSREESPMWKKPDWAFIEEGKPIPRNDEARFDPGSLGEYALYLGDGYMIHGTLYERFLGRSVSHGCIRVGRDDLREVWRATTIGTPVFIY